MLLRSKYGNAFGYVSRSEFAGTHYSSVFIFWGTLHTVFHYSRTNLHPHQHCTRFKFLYNLTKTDIFMLYFNYYFPNKFFIFTIEHGDPVTRICTHFFNFSFNPAVTVDEQQYLSYSSKSQKEIVHLYVSLPRCKYKESDLSPDIWDPTAAIGLFWDQFPLLYDFNESEYALTSAGQMTDGLGLIHIYLLRTGQTSYWFLGHYTTC